MDRINIDFDGGFLNEVARELVAEVYKAVAKGNRPYAAILFHLPPKGPPIEELSMENRHWSEHNRQKERQDHNAHAELLLLTHTRIAHDTDETVGNELYSSFHNNPSGRGTYCLFVNVPPCPMCMAAITNAQIQYTLYFVDNEEGGKPFILPEDVAKAYLKHSKSHKHKVKCDVDQVDVTKVDSKLLERLKEQAKW